MISRLGWFALFASLTAACTATPVFYAGGGSRWTLPLVTPLDDAEPMIPALINDKGPYVFVVDPDAFESVIDQGVAESLDLYLHPRYEYLNDQSYHRQPRRTYEVLSFASGDLHIVHVGMRGAPAGSLTYRGRRVDGILAGNLIPAPIVIDVDRDRGVLQLDLTDKDRKPPAAAEVDGTMHFGHLFVHVNVADRRLKFVAALGQGASSLWPALLGGLVPTPTRTVDTVDDLGTHVLATGGGVAPELRIDGLVAENVPFTLFHDERVRADDFDGVLGEDLFARWHVVFDRDAGKLWISPRATDLGAGAATRIARWPALAACAAAGCARIEGNQLHRDPAAGAAAYGLLLAASDGRRLQLDVVPETMTLPDGVWQVVDAAPSELLIRPTVQAMR
jgi:hypothetical protein